MKITLVFLIILGLIAGLCAVVLVAALQVNRPTADSESSEIDVMIAGRALPAMTVLRESDIDTKPLGPHDAPQGHFTNPAQVIGKILSMPVVEGQVLTGTSFVPGGSGAELAAALPPRMRAVSVTLSSQQITGGLLYPGCVVDVLATFRLSGTRVDTLRGEALSTTLLERIQVLAIEGESALSNEDGEARTPPSRRSSQRLTATLLVDIKQAEALQLATENGSIALALRNPLDEDAVPGDATVLNRGQLSKLATLMASSVKANPDSGAAPVGNEPAAVEQVIEQQYVEVQSEPAASIATQEPASWQVMVIRGREVKDEHFNINPTD